MKFGRGETQEGSNYCCQGCHYGPGITSKQPLTIEKTPPIGKTFESGSPFIPSLNQKCLLDSFG